jgi:hypothetical protein
LIFSIAPLIVGEGMQHYQAIFLVFVFLFFAPPTLLVLLFVLSFSPIIDPLLNFLTAVDVFPPFA